MDMLAGPLDSALIPALIDLRQKQGKAAAEALYSNVLAAAGAAFVIAALLAAARFRPGASIACSQLLARKAGVDRAAVCW